MTQHYQTGLVSMSSQVLFKFKARDHNIEVDKILSYFAIFIVTKHEADFSYQNYKQIRITDSLYSI